MSNKKLKIKTTKINQANFTEDLNKFIEKNGVKKVKPGKALGVVQAGYSCACSFSASGASRASSDNEYKEYKIKRKKNLNLAGFKYGKKLIKKEKNKIKKLSKKYNWKNKTPTKSQFVFCKEHNIRLRLDSTREEAFKAIASFLHSKKSLDKNIRIRKAK